MRHLVSDQPPKPDLKAQLAKVYDDHASRGCGCGMFERCEICDANSRFHALLNEIDELLHGPRKKPSAEDYGRIYTVKISKMVC